MSYACKLIAALCVVAAGAATVAAPAGMSSGLGERAGRNEDMLCGPLCVSFLLRSFGRPADVDVLSAEADWGDDGGGATMSGLVGSLRRRGLTVLPLRVTTGVPFRTTVPALVHLKADGGRGGHYVVLLPSTRCDVLPMWDPAEGRSSISATAFAERHSGAIALVSPAVPSERMVLPLRAMSPLVRSSWLIAVASGLCGGLAVAAEAGRGFRRHGIRLTRGREEVG
jgi:ABC-type bacteriocin/lantibiotic exporter with double-glycine peptidase domain